uniref:Uncharacterized protein n=1 Tax=Anguilla anguilla TaxID=7936 RepID=A0A0E9RUI3_ANGAN
MYWHKELPESFINYFFNRSECLNSPTEVITATLAKIIIEKQYNAAPAHV